MHWKGNNLDVKIKDKEILLQTFNWCKSYYSIKVMTRYVMARIPKFDMFILKRSKVQFIVPSSYWRMFYSSDSLCHSDKLLVKQNNIQRKGTRAETSIFRRNNQKWANLIYPDSQRAATLYAYGLNNLIYILYIFKRW